METTRGDRFAWILVLAGGAILAVLWVLFGAGVHDSQQGAPEEADITLSNPDVRILESPPVVSPMATVANEAGTQIEPKDVLDRSRQVCMMWRGKGAAAGLAGVAIPDDNQARYAILDATGTLHSGSVPLSPSMLPYNIKLGRNSERELIAGIGGMHVNEGLWTPVGWVNQPPLHIFRDGELMREVERAWMFDVAGDGSSYFFVEPWGNDLSTRLVIADLSYGTEVHHDLGTRLADANQSLAFLASYAVEYREVHLRPQHHALQTSSEGMGTHYFFDARKQAQPRQIRVADRGRGDRVLFASSEQAYFIYEADSEDAPLRIVKMSYSWTEDFDAATSQSAIEWQKEGPVNTLAREAALSPDGSWLLFSTRTADHGGILRESDRQLQLLDAETGDLVFSLPTGLSDVQVAELRNILEQGRDMREFVSGLGQTYWGASFTEDGKLAVRWLEDATEWASPSAYDVYDLDTIGLHSQPEYRIDSNQNDENPCASAGFPGTLVETGLGKLAFQAHAAGSAR